MTGVQTCALPICLTMRVFGKGGRGNITRALLGEKIGTLVSVTGEA